MVENYVEALICEIKVAKEIIAKKNLIVRSVYVGGGTPTVLSAEDLKRILSEINFRATELTVEAGRPDTITREKLSVLKEMGVTRICVNPQTFCERTLKAIGRNHGVKEILSAYEEESGETADAIWMMDKEKADTKEDGKEHMDFYIVATDNIKDDLTFSIN